MNRRELLMMLTAGTAGCLGPAGRADEGVTVTDEPSPSTGHSPTRTDPASRFPRKVAVAGVTDAPLRDAHDVAVEVSVPDGTVRPGQTARVRITLRTTGRSDRTLTYEQQHCGRNEFRARTDGFGLYLFPAGGEWTEATACPVVTRPNLSCGIPVVEASVAIPADAARTWRYDVVVPPGNLERGGCMAPGEYRFARRFTRSGAAAELRFSLSVTSP